MANSLISLLGKVFTPQTVQTGTLKTDAQLRKISAASNPFNPNPFVNTKTNMDDYAKNKPVQGGYFAGYYNGKPNIVGQRLFIEI